MVEDLLQRAMSAFKAGRKDEARGLFMDIVEQDPRQEQAWLHLSALVESLEEQQICLENVLTVNPNNQQAQQGLATIKQKLGNQQPAETPPEAPPDSWADFATDSNHVSPFGGPPPIGAEPDEATSSENLFGEPTFGESTGDSSSAFEGGFDFGTESTPDTAQSADDPFSWLNDSPGQPDTPAAPPPTPSAPAAPPPAESSSVEFSIPASSVDWGVILQPATYGSGQQIDEPTSDEYDQWMDSLPLGSEPAETAEVEESDSEFGSGFSSSQFSDTSFMVEDDTYADTDLFGDETPDSQPWDSSFESPASSPASDSSFATFGASSPDTPGGSDDDLFESAGGFVDDEPVETNDFVSDLFELDDDDDDDDDISFFDEPEPIPADSGGFDFSGTNAKVAGLPAETKSAIGSSASADAAPALLDIEYYRQIPPDIEPFEGGISQRTMMLVGGIGIMLILNIVSFLLLI